VTKDIEKKKENKARKFLRFTFWRDDFPLGA
jgi:hypothetical protein